MLSRWLDSTSNFWGWSLGISILFCRLMKKYLYSDGSWITVNDAAASVVSRVWEWLDFYSRIMSLALASIQNVEKFNIRNWIWQVKNTFFLRCSRRASYCEPGLNQPRGIPYTLHKSNMHMIGLRTRLLMYNNGQKIDSISILHLLCCAIFWMMQHSVTQSLHHIMNQGFKCMSTCAYL